MRVTKWDDGLAVRLPARMVAELGLKEGDEVEIRVVEEHPLEAAQDDMRAAALERINQFQWTLPPDYHFDRIEANES